MTLHGSNLPHLHQQTSRHSTSKHKNVRLYKDFFSNIKPTTCKVASCIIIYLLILRWLSIKLVKVTNTNVDISPIFKGRGGKKLSIFMNKYRLTYKGSYGGREKESGIPLFVFSLELNWNSHNSSPEDLTTQIGFVSEYQSEISVTAWVAARLANISHYLFCSQVNRYLQISPCGSVVCI